MGWKARSLPSLGFSAGGGLGRWQESCRACRVCPYATRRCKASSLIDVAEVYSSDLSESEKTIAYGEAGASPAGSSAGAALGASIAGVPVVGNADRWIGWRRYRRLGR